MTDTYCGLVLFQVDNMSPFLLVLLLIWALLLLILLYCFNFLSGVVISHLVTASKRCPLFLEMWWGMLLLSPSEPAATVSPEPAVADTKELL